MAPANHEARRTAAEAEYQNLLEEGQAIIEDYELYKPILISFEPRPDLRAAQTQMKTDMKNIHTKMSDRQCKYAAAGATDNLRTQQVAATQADALTAIRKPITHYMVKVPLPTPSTFKPIKALKPFMLTEDASSAVKEKWFRQYRTYYYQSKIYETDREMQLSLLTPCFEGGGHQCGTATLAVQNGHMQSYRRAKRAPQQKVPAVQKETRASDHSPTR